MTLGRLPWTSSQVERWSGLWTSTWHKESLLLSGIGSKIVPLIALSRARRNDLQLRLLAKLPDDSSWILVVKTFRSLRVFDISSKT
jgi:hypothetical protein